jgi:hypothetical protein
MHRRGAQQGGIPQRVNLRLSPWIMARQIRLEPGYQPLATPRPQCFWANSCRTRQGRLQTGRPRPIDPVDRGLPCEPDLTDIVLLGHSYGGTIVSKVVEKFPNVFGGSSSGTALCSATGRAYLRRCRRIIARCLNSLRNQPELVSAGVRRRMPGPVRPL